MKFEYIKNTAKQATGTAKDFANSEAGKEVGKGFGDLCTKIASNKYVVNTVAAGCAGALVGYLTFLPTDFCITIAMILGLYNTVTSR